MTIIELKIEEYRQGATIVGPYTEENRVVTEQWLRGALEDAYKYGVLQVTLNPEVRKQELFKAGLLRAAEIAREMDMVKGKVTIDSLGNKFRDDQYARGNGIALAIEKEAGE